MKKIVKFMLPLSILATLAIANPAYASDTMKVHLNGKEMKFNVDPVVHHMPNGDGITMVEFRPLFEAMGLEVIWNSNNPTQITGKKDGLEVVLHIGSKTAIVNDKEIDLAVAPQSIKNHTLVPLRFISEASGKDVVWTGGTDIQIDDTTATNTGGVNNSTPSNNQNTDLNTKTLNVFLNGKQVSHFQNTTPLTADRYLNYEQTDWFHLLRALGVNFNKVHANTGNIINVEIGNNKTLTLSTQGIFVDSDKVCDVGFQTALSRYIPIKPIVETLGFSYSEDATGVYITSK